MFSGSLVAIVTPMVEGGALDWAAWDRLLDFQVGEGSDGVRFGVAVGEERAEPVPVQRGPQTVEKLDVPGVGQVVDDDTDGPGAALGEAARHRVRAVTQLGDGLQHRSALRLAHPR